MGRTREEQAEFDETRDLVRLSWLLGVSLGLVSIAFFSRLPPPLTVLLSIPVVAGVFSLSSQRLLRLQAEWLLRGGKADQAMPDARNSRASPGSPVLEAVPAPPPVARATPKVGGICAPPGPGLTGRLRGEPGTSRR